MIESLLLDDSRVMGGLLILLVLAFLRFGKPLIDHLLLYQDSPVEAVEESISDSE